MAVQDFPGIHFAILAVWLRSMIGFAIDAFLGASRISLLGHALQYQATT